MADKESYLIDPDDTNIYKTDGYGGSHTDVDNTERFTDDIDLSVNTGAVVDFLYDGSDGTDDLVLTLYKRRNSSWAGNEHAWKSAITVDSDGTEKTYSYTIPGLYDVGHYRFGMKSDGAATTFEIQVDYRARRMTDGIT